MFEEVVQCALKNSYEKFFDIATRLLMMEIFISLVDNYKD